MALILVSLAVEPELAPWRRLRRFRRRQTCSSAVYETTIGGTRVVVVLAGVGVQRADLTAALVAEHRPGVGIVAGVAGGLKPELEPGEVLVAEAALAGYPDAQKRYALNTLGVALYRAGRIDEAIARLDESVKAFGGGVPQDWVFLAMAHHKKGHVEEARRWLEKTRAGVNDDPEVRLLLREAEALLKATAPSAGR